MGVPPPRWTRRLAAALVPLSAAMAGGQKHAEAATKDVENPFSEHRLALQLSDRDPAKQRLVLSVAFNLLTVYDVDKISMDVVCFGEGIDLLQVDCPERERVDSLIAQGVIFDACGNTIDTVERTTGHSFSLNPKARRVQAGVAKLLALSEAGYTLVRP